MTRAMVVGPLADWSTADVARGWVEGLTEAGCEVAFFNLADRLLFYSNAQIDGKAAVVHLDGARQLATVNMLGEAYRFNPDVVFIVHGAHVWPPLVADLRCPIVWVLTESPYEDEPQALTVAHGNPALILINDPTNQGVFESIAPTFYAPHAYRPAIHRPDGPVLTGSDVCFIGTGYPERIAMLEGVDWSGIDLTLGGMWEGLDEGSPLRSRLIGSDCIDNEDTAAYYRAARIGLNLYRCGAYGEHSTDDGYAIGPREVELAACGRFFLRDPRPESDELFPFLPSFTDPGELEELVRWWLPRFDERAALGEKARLAVEDRTFVNHARRALTRLGL